MQPSRIAADYLDALARELRFDIALSRRVRKEIEDHLWEASREDPRGDAAEAVRRTIARLGDARGIARQYADASLFAQTRRAAAVAVVALVGIFVAMKGRGAWYGLVQWDLPDHLRSLGAIGLPAARFAFLGALAVGIASFAYVTIGGSAAALRKGYGRHARRCMLLCTASAVALLACVVIDTLMTALRLFDATPSAAALVPFLSTGAEVVFIGRLFGHIRATIRRAAFVASLSSR